jgi:dynein intermediate chain 2
LTTDHVIYHFEGGWPKDLDITDENDKKKYIKKKIEKNSENQDRFTPSVKKMIDIIEIIINKNNEIDMFENYFEDEGPNIQVSDEINIKTLKIFKYGDDDNKR